MKSIYLEQVGKAIIKDVPKPVIKDNEVLIKSEYMGICGSDMHVYKGIHAFRKPPLILGHEIAGIVSEIGKNINHVKIGGRVTVMPATYCGECSFCKSGNTNHCISRIVPGTENWIGAFVEYFSVPESLIFCLPNSLNTRIGVLAEPLAVTIHALNKVNRQERKHLLILGSGTIGILAIIAAKNMGFEKIVSTDIIDYNVKMSLANGADRAVNVSKESLEEAVLDTFNGEKADAVIISAGSPDILDQAIESVHNLGTIVYIAMIVPPLTASTYPIVFKELTVIGSIIYSKKDFQDAINMLSLKPESFEKTITHCYNFLDGLKALEMVDKHKEGFIKVVLKNQ